MEVPDQSPLEVANHMAAKVKQHTRPWRAIIALVLAVGAGAVAASQPVGLRNVLGSGGPSLASRVIWASMTVAFCLFAAVALVGLAGKARDVLAPRAGPAHAAVVRYTIMLVGALILFVGLLELLKIPVTQLLVGGAITTIFIGIAAQQSLGNIFAGIVLLFSRPFQVGDSILLRSGALGGQLQGIVTEIGLTYVRLDTGDGVMHLPNSQVLASGVGQVRPVSPGPAGDGARAASQPGASGPASGPAPGQPAPGQLAPGQPGAVLPDGSPPSGGPASGDAPGSGGRPLSPPGL